MPALYTVVRSEVAPSASAGPETSTRAVRISVGAPPKATPHRAEAPGSTAGAPAARPGTAGPADQPEGQRGEQAETAALPRAHLDRVQARIGRLARNRDRLSAHPAAVQERSGR